jgi:hypothetical protein
LKTCGELAKRPVMQLLSLCRRLLFAVVALVGCLINSSVHAAGGPVAGRAVDFRTSGIRFRIAASVKADPASPYVTQHYDHAKASLAVRIRISAHARESQFFGEVSKLFSNFPMNEGSDEGLIWQDARCHQRRGLPKATVTAIDGSIAVENGQISVRGRPRQVGLPLPMDEITQGIRLPSGVHHTNALFVYRSRSKLSHLLVDVKIYAFNCVLSGK